MKMLIRAALVLVAILPLTLGGCFQLKQAATIYPDGSGKIDLTFGMKKSTLKFLERMAQLSGNPDSESPLDSFSNPKKLEENSKGVVAWSKPKWSEEGEFLHVSTTAYFEDINKVKLYTTTPGPGGIQERKLLFGCTYTETASGYTLAIDTDSRDELIPNEQDAAGLKALIAAFEGLKVSISIAVPGKITETKGFMKKEGNTAGLLLDYPTYKELVLNPGSETSRALKAQLDVEDPKIAWKETSTSAADLAAFREEMDEAKTAWVKIKAAARTKTEEEKKFP